MFGNYSNEEIYWKHGEMKLIKGLNGEPRFEYRQFQEYRNWNWSVLSRRFSRDRLDVCWSVQQLLTNLSLDQLCRRHDKAATWFLCCLMTAISTTRAGCLGLYHHRHYLLHLLTFGWSLYAWLIVVVNINRDCHSDIYHNNPKNF